jgi:hypothetical protein
MPGPSEEMPFDKQEKPTSREFLEKKLGELEYLVAHIETNNPECGVQFADIVADLALRNIPFEPFKKAMWKLYERGAIHTGSLSEVAMIANDIGPHVMREYEEGALTKGEARQIANVYIALALEAQEIMFIIRAEHRKDSEASLPPPFGPPS